MNNKPGKGNRPNHNNKADFDLILKNDPVYKLERWILRKYSKKLLFTGIFVSIIVPPYIMYWKRQQMKVSPILTLIL